MTISKVCTPGGCRPNGPLPGGPTFIFVSDTAGTTGRNVLDIRALSPQSLVPDCFAISIASSFMLLLRERIMQHIWFSVSALMSVYKESKTWT